MIVLKFGGTSVGTAGSLKNVKAIVEGLQEPAIVVVSALGGLTDKLIATAEKAAAGDPAYKDELPGMAQRHRDIIDALVLPENKEEVSTKVETLLSELFRLYDGLSLIADLPQRTLDSVVSYGERMSSVIVSGIIRGASYHYSPDFIKTEKWFEKNIADTEHTNRLIKEEFGDNHTGVAVMGGFISSDRDSGEITNLGRGGSDYTAALVAAALNADVLEIWTDVDGFMTSDPRIIPSARIIPEMTFVESMELCSFGAKVIYPPTIYPVFHKNIPIKILNTFNPDAPGTLITDKLREGEHAVTGISSLKDTAIFTLRGSLCRNVAEISTRSFNALARKGISVYLVAQTPDPEIFSFALSKKDVAEAAKLLADEFAPEITSGEISAPESTTGLSTIAVVGEKLSQLDGLAMRIINTLNNEGIKTFASSNGTSRITATFVIKEEDTNRGLALIHSLFFPE